MWVLWQYLKKKGLKKVVFCLPCLKEIPFESSKCAFSDSKNASTISIKCLKKHTIKKMLNSKLIISLSSFYHWLNVNAEHSWQRVHNSLVRQTDHQEWSKIILLKTTVLHFDSSNAKVFPSLCGESWQKFHFITLNQFQTMEAKKTRDCVKKVFQGIVS